MVTLFSRNMFTIELTRNTTAVYRIRHRSHQHNLAPRPNIYTAVSRPEEALKSFTMLLLSLEQQQYVQKNLKENTT